MNNFILRVLQALSKGGSHEYALSSYFKYINQFLRHARIMFVLSQSW